MTAEAEPVKVFYSYAHEDEDLRNKLNKHLSLLRRQRFISEWHDRCITAGREWKNEIDQHLQEARLILLLISSDFIASDYCYEVEMQQALDKHEARAARVVPIILRPTYWQNSPFSELKCLPTDAKPVTTWPNRDEAFVDIVKGICEIITELQAQPALSVPTAELRKRYLQIMADEWNTLSLLRVLDSNVVDPRSHPVALEQVYVELDTTSYRGSALSALCNVDQWGIKQEWEMQHFDLDDLEHRLIARRERRLTKQEQDMQPRVVLLGQPGSGKSTLHAMCRLSWRELC